MINKAKAIEEEIIRLRREIHQHPELGFQEFRTAQLVADTLQEIGGIDIQTEVGRTGVVGRIGTGDGPTIGIRADMDALPIHEQVDVPFKSQHDGVMHACGHDAHTAILLGVAHLLRQSFADEGEKWRGNVRFLFQPSEEQWGEDGISGATAMIQDNALENVDAVIALHTSSLSPSGQCSFWDGPTLAAADMFDAWIRGDGGHGAYPHQGIDPNFILSTVLSNLYAIPSRYISPLETNVVSVGAIHAGQAPNVIPKEVYVNGTIRSMDQSIRKKLWAEVERAFSLAETLGGSYEFKLRKGYPPTINDARVNGWMRQVAREVAGEGQVIDAPMGMAGEDFSIMSQKAPGAMFSLGCYTPGGGGHHTPLFDIDEKALHVGAAVLAETARRFVKGELG